jgi:dephospho-CoA kinase
MIIGLTGGSGSGKTIVARVFEILGCKVFRSDEYAKSAYLDAAVKAQIIALLGAGAYDGDALNRKFVRERIFSNPSHRTAVNNIIHPAVGTMFRKFAEENKGATIVKESALLFEAGVEKQADKIVVVTAAEDIRIARIMERDGITRDEAAARLASQMPEEEKTRRADFVVHNDETRLVIPQVLDIFNRIRS